MAMEPKTHMCLWPTSIESTLGQYRQWTLPNGIISQQQEACCWADGDKAQQLLHNTGQVVENTNAQSGAGQDHSTFSIVLLTQASPHSGEPEREPRTAFDIVMLCALPYLFWWGALCLGEGCWKARLALLFGLSLLSRLLISSESDFCAAEPELSLRLMYLGFLRWWQAGVWQHAVPAPAFQALPALALRCATRPAGTQLLHGVTSEEEEPPIPRQSEADKSILQVQH